MQLCNYCSSLYISVPHYVSLSLCLSTCLQGKSDMDKYGKAIQLKGCIDKVRKDYTKKIKQEVRTTPYCTVLV